MNATRYVATVAAAFLMGVSASAESVSTPETDAQAWEDFANQIKDIGVEFLSADRDLDPATDAEAVRYLTRQLGAAFADELSAASRQPVLRLSVSNIHKIGLDASEAKYTDTWIEPDGVYRLWGKLGTAQRIAIQLYGIPDKGASLDHKGLEADADGNFEVVISANKPEDWNGPWLKIAPSNRKLLIREYFDDWSSETPSEFYVERIDGEKDSEPLTQSEANKIITSVGENFKKRLPYWITRVDEIREQAAGENLLLPTITGAQGLEGNVYGLGWFNIKPDEAAIIELNPPKAEFWSIQLGNYWWESLDYASHTSSLTQSQAKPSADGTYRFVISQKDPGIENWLDPTGHQQGMILYRYMFHEGESPTPTIEKVPFDSLASLPEENFPRITPEERKAEIRARASHLAKRWAP